MELITIESVIGNINREKDLKEKYEEMSKKNLCETIRISRFESQRVRMRRVSSKGTDIALTLPQGTKLKHGDVIMLTEDRMIAVEIEPESVAVVEVRNNIHEDERVEVPVRIGHTIGNLHRPIKLEGNKIYFPIQAETEIEMFRKLFTPLEDHVEIRATKMVFEPEEEMDVHEH